MRDRILGLKQISVSKLRGFAGNPKTYNEDDRSLLKDSLDNHGYVIPIAVREVGDGTFEIIDGHHRKEIIDAEDANQKIKCIVLDVASVAEGRRILLALQHHAGYDMSKLEEFVKEAMKEGVQMSDLMVDTGLTGSELDAFSAAGAEFLDGILGQKPPENLDEGGPSRKGLTTEHVHFSLPLARDQAPIVHKAVKMAKTLLGTKISADALVSICQHYIDTHKEGQ